MEEKKNNKKKILIYSILGIITVLIVTLTITYAYWILTRQQTGENIVNTACLNISFTGENDITLDKAYPMNDEQLDKFLSTETPYHFTIHNECDDLASATINLESLNTEAEKQLEDQYINAILYEDDYHNNLNSVKKLNASIYNDENKVIANSLHAYSLYNFNLKPDETRDFNLLLYMDPDTPMVDANMNASWKGKITLSTGYKEDSKSLRKISSSDTNGMWGYKDKLTKIVIEDTKSEKEAPDGGKVYGPFDESEYGTKAVESYVVCEADDNNCVGYLQGDGKVVLNPDSSYVFANFSKINKIDGLEKLNTSNVINMGYMFYNNAIIEQLDLSMWDTEKLQNIAYMFSGMSNLQTLNISNWIFKNSMSSFASSSGLISTIVDTLTLDNINVSNMTNMGYMFKDLVYVKELDLSNLDTSHVLNISYMFSGMTNLKKLKFEGNDLSNVVGHYAVFSYYTEDISIANCILPADSSDLFQGDSNLLTLNLTNVDTSQVTSMRGMFSGCSGLTQLDLSSFDTTNVTEIGGMFASSNLETLNLSNWKFNDNMTNNFTLDTGLSYNNTLKNIILENVDTSEVTNMTYFFSKLNALTTLDLSYFDTSNVKNMARMFNSSSLTSVTFGPNFKTNNVTTMSYMFYGCSNLQELDLSNWDTNSVENMLSMFGSTTSLQHITFGPKFVHKPEATTTGMFSGCPAPERPTGDTWQDVSFD